MNQAPPTAPPNGQAHSAPRPQLQQQAQSHYTLALLTLMSAVAFMDRQILAVLIQPVKAEFGLSDLQIGLITGLGFALSFAMLGVPLGRLADRGRHRRLIVACRSLGGLLAATGAAAMGFWSLMLSRCGGAVSDAGAGPASMALLAELYPVEQRSRVLSVFGTGSSLGALLALLLGAWIAQQWGWRWTLAIVGASSIALALLLRLSVAEPQSASDASNAGRAGQQPGAVRELLALPLTRWLLLGAACAFLAGYGFGTWNFSLLVRRHGLSLAQAGMVSAGAALVSVLGGLCSGALTDRLARRDPRWQIGVPALGLLLATPCGLAYLLLPPGPLLLAGLLIWAYAFFVIWWVAPVFAALSLVVGPARRAMASALILLTGALIGNGLGPIAAGWLSDMLTRTLALSGPGDGLRWALVLMVLTLLPGALAFVMAMRSYGPALRHARADAALRVQA